MFGLKQSQVNLNYLDHLVLKILKCGELPNHIALIMDGNRRYGKSKDIASKKEVYLQGFNTAAYINNLCLTAGIKEVTLYVFSIENFKRPPEELAVLLDDILPQAMCDILKNCDKYRRLGVQVRIIGNLQLFKLGLQKLLKEVMDATKGNSRMVLNLALSYTARDEISAAIRTVAEDVQRKSVEMGDINVCLIQDRLYLPRGVDCLVRTSGELRFSDFLLWQIDNSRVYIHPSFWPEFGRYGFLKVILDYQRSRSKCDKFAV